VRGVRWAFWLPLLLAALLFPLVPGYPLAQLPGLPLDAPGLGALALAGILFFGWAPRQPACSDRYFVAVLLGLAVLKVGTHMAALDYGLRASYYSGSSDAQLGRVPERSFEYRGLDATRLDRQLSFDARTVPGYFWNDMRYNFYLPTHPARQALPLRVTWSGYLYAPATGNYTLQIAADTPATLAVDDVRLDLAEGGVATATVNLTEGAHPLSGEYWRPYGAPIAFAATWDRGEGPVPLAAPYLLPASTTPARWHLAQDAHAVANLLAGLYGLALAGVAFRLAREWWQRRRDLPGWAWERPMLALVLLVGLVWAYWQAWPYAQEVPLFTGSDDWLTFESNARDIALYGPLQLRGAEPGAAIPFSEQPAYAYALAALHLLTGDSLYGTIVVQHFWLALEVVLVYGIARRLFGRPAAVAAAALLAAEALVGFQRTARTLFSENLLQLLLPLAVLALLALVDRPRLGRALLAGLLLGLSVVTRYTALLYLPLAMGATWWTLRSGVGRARASGLLLALVVATVAVLALVPLRNALAAGRPVLMPTSASINLSVTAGIPETLDLVPIESGPWSGLYRAAGWTRDSGQAQWLEHLRQAPAAFLAQRLYFVRYALGLGDHGPEGRTRLDFLPIALLYGVAWTAWRETGRAVCWLVHGFVLTHLLVIAVFGINTYPPRLVLPMYVLMPAVSGFGAVVVGRWLAAAGLRVPPAVLARQRS
jgi:4-amino-4-deoxy-L-arabinose transferase-like glycosyltransferase